MASSARQNLLNTLLLIVIVVMGCEMVYLIYQNRQLRSALDQAPAMQVLQRGQTVPPLTTTDLDGNVVAIHYGDGEPATVLIWFSPTCHVCADNAPFWNDIYERYCTSSEIRFLAMSDAGADETRGYVTEQAMRFPVVCATRASLVDAYNGRVMPQTALISPRGTIEQVWPGALEASRRDEIIAELDSLTH